MAGLRRQPARQADYRSSPQQAQGLDKIQVALAHVGLAKVVASHVVAPKAHYRLQVQLAQQALKSGKRVSHMLGRVWPKAD